MDEVQDCKACEQQGSPETDDALPMPIPPNSDDIPNGGIIAWLQVMGSFFLFFNTWGVVNAFGVFQSYYEKDLLASEGDSNIAWVGSIQAFLLMAMGTIAGPLFDLGYFRHMLLTGSVLNVLGIMMTSIAKEYWQVMLAQAVCTGLGSGLLFVPCVAITSTYFSTKRALALGIASSGSSIGAVIYSIVFHRLQSRIGFPQATRVIGYIMLGTLVVPVLVMRTRVLPSEKRSFLALNAFKEPPFAIFSLAVFLGFTGLYVPFYYISSYGINKLGMKPELGFYLVPILNAGSVFGRLFPNYLADIVGPLNILIPFTFGCLVLAFAWIGIQNTPGIIVFAVLYGFTSGTYVSLPPATIASLTKDLHHVGTRMGTCFLCGAFGILIGNPIAGTLVDPARGSFWKAQVFCGALVVGAVACLVLARIAKTGFLWKVKA